jgi:hypothetical protein
MGSRLSRTIPEAGGSIQIHPRHRRMAFMLIPSNLHDELSVAGPGREGQKMRSSERTRGTRESGDNQSPATCAETWPGLFFSSGKLPPCVSGSPRSPRTAAGLISTDLVTIYPDQRKLQ